MKCNNCEKIDEKIKKTQKEYDTKTKGAKIISNPDSQKQMLDQINENYQRKLSQLNNVKSRHCK